MAANNEIGIVPSLLDRLLDDDPGNSREPITSRLQNLRALENSVARDLEALLNTKQETLQDLPSEFIRSQPIIDRLRSPRFYFLEPAQR